MAESPRSARPAQASIGVSVAQTLLRRSGKAEGNDGSHESDTNSHNPSLSLVFRSSSGSPASGIGCFFRVSLYFSTIFSAGAAVHGQQDLGHEYVSDHGKCKTGEHEKPDRFISGSPESCSAAAGCCSSNSPRAACKRCYVLRKRTPIPVRETTESGGK